MASEEVSAAARLLQKHAQHPLQPTVEDAPDDEATPSTAAAAPADPTWAPTMTPKTAGKQPAGASSALDTHSHEAFPELGVPKANVPRVVYPPIWAGAKGGSNGNLNGTSWSANGTPRTSTPTSGAVTPTGAPPLMSIPGRNVESIVVPANSVLPRSQLKRPIPDLVKDINRKSRAVITMATAPNGQLKFEASGPSDKALAALNDLVSQITRKVGADTATWCIALLINNFYRKPAPFRSRNPQELTSLASKALRLNPSKRNLVQEYKCPRSTRPRPIRMTMTML